MCISVAKTIMKVFVDWEENTRNVRSFGKFIMSMRYLTKISNFSRVRSILLVGIECGILTGDEAMELLLSWWNKNIRNILK